MEQGTRWAVRGDHLRGGDYSAMLTLERCCHANSARGAAQSPHAWHVGDRKAVSRGVSKVSLDRQLLQVRGRANFFFRHPASAPAAGGLVGGHAGPVQNGAP